MKYKIFRFQEIDSTNNAAFRYAEKGAPHGSVFVANYQTDGRGKWGRRWVSPKGKNLLFSLLLRPQMKASHASGLTQVACRSVAKVLERSFRLNPSFKRPNDILVNQKKICGVLLESKGRSSGALDSLVIGIGLNVNSFEKELVKDATSLRRETGRRHSRSKVMMQLLKQLKHDLKGV